MNGRVQLFCRLRISLVVLVAVSFSLALPAHSQTDAGDRSQGLELLGRLSRNAADPVADRAVFQQVGVDNAQKLLLAVATHGMDVDATTADWAAMHRAYAALIELCAGEQQFLKASIYANLQDQEYRRDEGDYEAALAAARQALDLQQRSGHLETISIPWENLGVDLIYLGHLDEGMRALYQARKLLQDPTSSLAADIRTRIITLDSSRGDSSQAHQESEDFLRAAGPNTPAVFRAGALLAAANLDIDDRRYDDAIARVHEALRAIKDAPDGLTAGYQAMNVLMTIGLAAMENLPYDQAIELCNKLDKDFPGLPVSIGGFAHQVGNHRRRLAGQFDLVLRDDAAQLEQARKAHDVSAEVYTLLATAVDYAYMRETTEQVAALVEAANILHSPAGAAVPPDTRFRVLERLGEAQVQAGDLRAARAAYTEVLSGIEATPSAQLRQQLGTIYADAKLGMAALLQRDGYARQARQILDEALNPPPDAVGRFTRSDVLLQLAALEETAAPAGAAQQPSDDATHTYLDAIAELHKQKDVNTEVYARLKLVHYLATKGANATAATPAPRPDASAIASAREQLALARAAASSVDLADAGWRIRFLEGILDQDTGNSDTAIRDYADAAGQLDRIRAGLSEEEARKSFVDNDAVQELYRRQINLLTAKGSRDQAWQYLERDKARSFLESLHGRRFQAPPAPAAAADRPGAELDRLEQQIIAMRLSLSPENDSTLRQSGRSPEALHVKLIALENQFALARQQSMLGAGRATQPLALAPIEMAATQSRLPARTALVEYAVLDGEMAAFVITHASANEVHWPADTSRLPGMLRRLNDQLASPPSDDSDLDAQLDAASGVLLAPVLNQLPPDIDKLIVVPTQSLALIPFQALPLPRSAASAAGKATTGSRKGDSAPGPASRPLLIDRYSVAYLPSASTLEFLRFGAPSASGDLFLGAIGDISSENLPPLPGTVAETAAIQKLYPNSVRVVGPGFTHDVAVKALLDHQEVHFATHGLFEEQAPLFSALMTAPSSGQPSRLSLYELTNLNVNARLVILSACETDRGQITGGDEAAGLTRTFLQAGAENVVSSLWKVSDESTAMLMERLHAHLRQGELTPDALRHAELEVRQKFPQPFYWAAFVDTGVR